jgi:hypothetical protein
MTPYSDTYPSCPSLNLYVLSLEALAMVPQSERPPTETGLFRGPKPQGVDHSPNTLTR